MKNATSIKYHNNNSSVDSIGNDKSFESENELNYCDHNDIREKKRLFINLTKNVDRRKKELSKDKKLSLWNALYHTVFNHKSAFKNNINIHDINLRFNLSIFKNEEEIKRIKNKNENNNTCYTQLKNYLNLFNNSKKHSRNIINNNRPKSVKVNNLNIYNDYSKSPEIKNKPKGSIATIKNLSRKFSINQEMAYELHSKKQSSNIINNDRKESKLGIKNPNSVNPDKIFNEINGVNFNSINSLNQNQNSQNYKNIINEDFQNQNINNLNHQSKVLPLNYRKNSISILARYDIKDLDSLMNFIEREKTSNKKVIEDEREKENFNHIISNKYAYEVELEKYTNYIQKRPNMKLYEHLIDFRKAENFFQLNRDMPLVDRYGNNMKEIRKYIDRIDIIDSTIFEKLDFSKKFDLNEKN